MLRQSGIKISQFLKDGSLNAASLFTYVKDATNYAITYGNFLPLLGATGTIEQLGGISGAAVLYHDGTVNYIRNFEGGQGIDVSINVDDGVTVSHNFTVNSTGEPIMLNESASSPTFVSLVAGNGITLTSANDTITIDSSSPVASNYGLVSLQGNSTATVITTVNVPVLIAGTWTSVISSNFIGSTAGRLTYTASDARIFAVDFSCCLNPSSASKNLGVILAKNGSVINASTIDATITAATERFLGLTWALELQMNDYIEVYVVNKTDDVNIVVHNALLRAFG